MSFVRNLRELESNAFYLADIIHSDGKDRSIAVELIGKGRAFLPFFYEGKIAFSPSKFVGYRSNTLDTHIKKRAQRDGKDTNREINRILGQRYVEDVALHSALEQYCISIGANLENHKHRFWTTQSAIRYVGQNSSAINDMDHDLAENDDPKYLEFTSHRYSRNDKVRTLVRRRADGKCEYCQSIPFAGRKGGGFVECHHIISLSARGADNDSNVIGLCPNHHREAHLGENWEALNREFENILKRMVK